jgi:hypothetical protein
MLGASLRLEAKPQKYPTGGKVVAWERGLLGKFSYGDFDSIILHRFQLIVPSSNLCKCQKTTTPVGEMVMGKSLVFPSKRQATYSS